LGIRGDITISGSYEKFGAEKYPVQNIFAAKNSLKKSGVPKNGRKNYQIQKYLD
jgi:hypothetical protein